MARKKIANEFIEKVLMDSAWKSLSEDFQWTEQWLEKYKDKVDWKEISGNRNILWSPSMLEKFKKLLDWKSISGTNCQLILTEECLERFKDYWDWSELSENTTIELNYALIDKFIDNWDWTELINRWHEDSIYSAEFLEKYIEHIPSSKLQDSRLWQTILDERIEELKSEVIA